MSSNLSCFEGSGFFSSFVSSNFSMCFYKKDINFNKNFNLFHLIKTILVGIYVNIFLMITIAAFSGS